MTRKNPDLVDPAIAHGDVGNLSDFLAVTREDRQANQLRAR